MAASVPVAVLDPADSTICVSSSIARLAPFAVALRCRAQMAPMSVVAGHPNTTSAPVSQILYAAGTLVSTDNVTSGVVPTFL